MEPDALKPLRQAADGLTYPSESDEPFDAFRWDGTGAARDQIAAHARKGRKIEAVPVDAIFGQLDEADDAERFRALRQVLESTVKDLQIFRAVGGDAEVDVFLVGQLASGQLAGLHTISVET